MNVTTGNIFRKETDIWRPGKLWSLWDMQKVFAQHYLRLGMEIQDIRSVMDIIEAMNSRAGGDDDRETLSSNEQEDLFKTLRTLKIMCEDLALPVSRNLVENALGDQPQTEREYAVIVQAVRAELKDRVFLYLPPHQAKFYERDDMLSDQARAAFPLAYQEIREAGNSFASDLSTASVFHCMRALEHGLTALASDVDVIWDVQQWHNVINEIDKAIRKLGDTLPRGNARNERLQFLSDAALEFSHFKDGWRNYVAHNKASYGEAQALQIMDHVRSFFETLSRSLEEKA